MRGRKKRKRDRTLFRHTEFDPAITGGLRMPRKRCFFLPGVPVHSVQRGNCQATPKTASLTCLGGISVPCCPPGGNLSGLPAFSDIPLPTGHGLRTLADLRSPRLTGSLLSCPRRPQHAHLEAVPALQGARPPDGLWDVLSTVSPPCSPPFGGSAADPRLDTGGWLALARQGLAPCKKCRALFGARTFKLRGAPLLARPARIQ